MKSYSFKEKKSWPFADSKKRKIGIWDYEKKKKSPHKVLKNFLCYIKGGIFFSQVFALNLWLVEW